MAYLVIIFLVCEFKYTSCNYFTRYVHLYEGCRISYICEQYAATLHWLWAVISLKGVCLRLFLLHTAAYIHLL